MAFDAKIILDSVTPAGARLTTFQITIPRIVLAELNTHKMVSKNSASSRAIPVKKRIAQVLADPFVPKAFARNTRGMQPAANALEGEDHERALRIWLNAIEAMTEGAQQLADVEVHKQLANRLIEFCSYWTVVATATEWSNAFALRDHPHAQDEIRDPMHLAKELYDKSEPVLVPSGEWHLPYVIGYDVGAPDDGLTRKFVGGKAQWYPYELVQMSVGRCAAVSYLNQENQLDPAGDIRRTVERLIPSGHMSPTEHVAQSLTRDEWVEYAEEAATKWIEDRIPVGNLWGWKQYRKTIENEHDFALVQKGGEK